MRSLLAVLLLTSLPAWAETWISAPIASYHLKRDSDKNERNVGLGVEHSISERSRIAGGLYRNSNNIDSGYLVGVWCSYRSTRWCAGGLAGLVTGYERHAIVMGGAVLAYERKSWGANLLVFPKDGGVFGVQLKWRLD